VGPAFGYDPYGKIVFDKIAMQFEKTYVPRMGQYWKIKLKPELFLVGETFSAKMFF
jgi:hypothetical protein